MSTTIADSSRRSSPASGTGASATGASATGASATGADIEDGTAFTDPDGTYTIVIGPDWTEAPTRPVANVEQWVVAPVADGFAPNVNVLTQDVPGMTLERYVDLSLDQLTRFDVIDSSIIDRDDGGRLGRIDFAGTLGTGANRRALHFLALFAVDDDEAIVATFSAGENDFEALRVANEPYLRTLRHI